MQSISIIQQGDDGESKVKWLTEHEDGFEIIQVLKLPLDLPVLIDDPAPYLADLLLTDLVLTFVSQPDIMDEIVRWCGDNHVVLVASGQRLIGADVFCPSVCCSLRKSPRLGQYAKKYGAPDLRAKVQDGRFKNIEVLRGAPCGATWLAAEKVLGMPVEEGITRFGLEVQFNCTANPASWDPLWGKSPVHTAAHIHSKALEHAVKEGLE